LVHDDNGRNNEFLIIFLLFFACNRQLQALRRL